MYWLDIEMVPSFVSAELARKILLTGKSVNFIRLCCPGQEWLHQGKTLAATGTDGNLSRSRQSAAQAQLSQQQKLLLALPGGPRDVEDVPGSLSGEADASLRREMPLADLSAR